MAAATKKNTLCQLWGITSSVVDEKITILKSILGDITDNVLLDYLTKNDLNIEQCINFHFTNISSQSPTPQSHNNNTNNNNEIEMSDSSNNNSNNTNNSNKALHKRRRRPTRRIRHNDDDEYNPNEDNINMKYNNKKRQRSSTIKNNNNNKVIQPQLKKRKVSENNNSNSKEERDSDDDDDVKHENKEILISKNDCTQLPIIPSLIGWTSLSFGTIKLKYTLIDDEPYPNLNDMYFMHKKGKLKLELLS
eukprot:483442_1